MSDQNRNPQLIYHLNAELILNLALRWRREQLKQDSVGESTYAIALGAKLDEMVEDITGKTRILATGEKG